MNESTQSFTSITSSTTTPITSSDISTSSANSTTADCIQTPCYVNGIKTFALIDSGAKISLISLKLVNQLNLSIIPTIGKLTQCISNHTVDRIGQVNNVILENGNKRISVSLKVVNLEDDELIIGIDLFHALGYTLRNIPFTLPTVTDSNQDNRNNNTLENCHSDTSAQNQQTQHDYHSDD